MKRKGLFLIALFAMILVTGCFSKELAPDEVFKKSLDNMKNMKSAEVVTTFKAKVKSDGVSVDMEIPFTIRGIETDEKGEKADFSLSMGENTFIDKMDIFFNIDIKQGINLYFPSTLIDSMFGVEYEESQWLYYNLLFDELENEDINIDQAEIDKLNNLDFKKVIGDNFKYVDNNENINHYTLTINQELIDRLANELNEETEQIDGEVILDIYINKETKNITKISSDLKNIIANNIGEEDKEVLSMIEEVSFIMEFKDINKVDSSKVVVPNDIKNNSKSAKDYIEEISQKYPMGID